MLLYSGQKITPNLGERVRFEDAWAIANDHSRWNWYKALDTLAANKQRLPGFVYVDLHSTLLKSKLWGRVVEASEAMCACGTRRMLSPLQNQPELRPGGQVHMVCATRNLLIAPWGGDLQSAFLKIEMSLIGLVVTRLPFAPTKAHYGAGVPTPLETSVVRQYIKERGGYQFAVEYGNVSVAAGSITALDTQVACVYVSPTVSVVTSKAPDTMHVCK